MSQTPSAQPDSVALKLARVWLQRGKPAHAIQGLRNLLQQNVRMVEAYVLLGGALLHQDRAAEAELVFAQGLAHDPNLPELHKGLIESIIAQNGIDAAFRRYQLQRLDSRPIDTAPDAVCCCSVVRNELVRLPFFLDYYRQLGVRRFFVVDNVSSDGTEDYLLAQDDVHLWCSQMSFNQANFGSAWFELLLRRYGRNRWWVMADADELLVYPDAEMLSLPALCQMLDAQKKRALPAILIDMYNDLPIAETIYRAGEDFRTVCPFFDRQFYHRSHEHAGPYHNMTLYEGGARERVFGPARHWFQIKTPLLRYDTDCILSGGQHLTNLPATLIANAQGAVLHFKYFSSFPGYARQEAERGEHHAGAKDYQEYVQALANDHLSFFDPQHSVRLEGSAQLERLGALRRGEIVAAVEELIFPPIRPMLQMVDCPFWSVMITVYGRTDYLKQALLSVLSQALSAAEMEIVVVSDGGISVEQQQAIASCVQEFGQGRVRLHQLAENAGHPHIFSICLDLATGQWVHILHDDDTIEPDFYAALTEGIAAQPELGAAFCRCRIVDERGNAVRETPLEQEQAGPLQDWLNRIAAFCRLQTPAIAVRRAAYEQVGGYCPAARSAFDWEMWQRLATHFAVWYEPRTLATYRQHNATASSSLLRNGGQVADALMAIEVAQRYLPADRRADFARAARANYARRALQLAQQFANEGDVEAVLANLRAAVKCSQAEDVTSELLHVLTTLQSPIAADAIGPAFLGALEVRDAEFDA